jgi:hypothetical protein
VRIAAVCLAIGAVVGDQHGASAGTSGATIIDQAGLFTPADNRTINRTAAAAGLHFIVVTDSRSPGNGNSWMQRTLAAYAAPDVVILAIHVDVAQPSQSLVVVWSGRALGLTSTQDQAEANTLIASNPSSPLADRIDAMIWRLKAESDADLRDNVAAATAAQIGIGIRSITALMVILAWIFVFLRRRRRSAALWLPTRLVGCLIFSFIALLWLGAAWNSVSFYTKSDPALAPAYSAGYIAGTSIIDLVVALGAAGIARRLVRRQPKAAPDLPS